MEIDPLGLINFGTGMNSTGLAIESAARKLSPEKAQSTINDIVSTNGAWTPGHEYVSGLAIGAPMVALSTIYGPAASITKVIQSSAIFCASNVTYQWVQYEKVQPSDAIAAALTGALYPGRSLRINTLIASGIAYVNSGSKSGAAGAGVGTAVSGVMGKIPLLSNVFGDYAAGLISEGTSDNVGKIVSKDSTND